jgi:hypothetical protein
MNESEFKENAQISREEYRAECASKNRHWKGKWQATYHAAFNEGDAHRYGGKGENEMHNITILMRVTSSGNI